MLMANVDKPSQKLYLIDAIQRLGVSYHFENDIEDILKEIYKSHCESHVGDSDDDELYVISLKFRLLRQQGYKLSSGMSSLFFFFSLFLCSSSPSNSIIYHFNLDYKQMCSKNSRTTKGITSIIPLPTTHEEC